MRKELPALTTDFEKNIDQGQKAGEVHQGANSKACRTIFCSRSKPSDDEYTVMANITWHYLTVLDNCKERGHAQTIAQSRTDNLAREENIPLLQKILVLRDDIAHKLGYKTYADYETETKMVKNAETAIDFLEKLKTGLQPKFDAELAEFRKLKVEETGDANAKINIWDWRYFANQLKKQKYNVDAEATARLLPLPTRARRHVRHLPAHLRPEIRARRAALQMDRRPATLRRVATPKPASRSACSTSTCSRAKANTITSRNSASSKANCCHNGKYQRPVVRVDLQFPARPPTDHPSLMSHRRRGNASSTNSATRCTPS